MEVDKDMQRKIAARRANYAVQAGKLALENWRLAQQIETIESQIASHDKTIRLLLGADQEAEISKKEFDVLQEIAQAQREAAKETVPPVVTVIDATPVKPEKP